MCLSVFMKFLKNFFENPQHFLLFIRYLNENGKQNLSKVSGKDGSE